MTEEATTLLFVHNAINTPRYFYFVSLVITQQQVTTARTGFSSNISIHHLLTEAQWLTSIMFFYLLMLCQTLSINTCGSKHILVKSDGQMENAG